MNLKSRAAAVALSAATVASILAGCASTSTSHSGSTGMPSMNASGSVSQHNTHDVTFAQMMIVHHQGALQMAQTATEKGKSAAVRNLAAKIQQAQTPEIDTMTGWSDAWGRAGQCGQFEFDTNAIRFVDGRHGNGVNSGQNARHDTT